MKKFESFESYEKWTESFSDCSDYEEIPVVIDDGWKISADMFTSCKSYKTAIRRFAKTFASVPEVDEWIDGIRESCDNGYFKESSEYNENGSYSWGVEETMEGYWYVFLNISGIHANRERKTA